MSRLIDADALKEQFTEGAYTVKGIREEIDNAPTVEITDYDTGYQDGLEDGLNDIRPQGKWVEGYHDYFETLDCSICGYVRDERHLNLNYCPNCGADMRGVKHENR